MLAVVCGYGAGVLVPYFADDLHTLPLREVAGGAHDPGHLWPRGTAFERLTGVGHLSLLGTWLVIPSAVLAGQEALRAHRRGGRSSAVLLLTVLVLSAAVTLVHFSPFGAAVNAWFLD